MPSTTQCAACKAPLPENAGFCPTCGTPARPAAGQTAARAPYLPPDPQGQAADRRQILQSAVGDACEVRELIGRGGFAEVYAGWDVRLKREVAIKTIRADVSSTSLLERFQREAEAVAKLRHPHIIPVYGVGETNGIAYFTMPRISGESLAAALEREKRLPVGEACRILSEAAGALDEAHRSGVIHRDIKPENIMLEGRDRRALVMDFGISKSAETAERGLTGTGMVMGTPEYMSPEQAAGDRQLDHRSDQYSLAMIGYRMLTGRPPFEADSLQTLLVKQVTETPPPLRSIVPEVPEPVAAAIERALAKRPEDRFPSMGDFAEALSAARDTIGSAGRIRRRAPSLPERIERMRALFPGWRHPLTIAAVVAAIVFVALMPRSVPDIAMDIAAQRDDADFAARAHLASRGITGPFTTRRTPESRTAPIRFLRENVGNDSIARLVRAGVPLWLWHARVRAGDGPVYHLDVGADGRITRFEEPVPDTATATLVEPQRAESLAVAELVSRGWDVASLRRQPDSTVTRPNRVDRYFRWHRPDVAIGWRGADSARTRLQVRVSGDRVTDYSELLTLPPAYVRQTRGVLFDVIATVAWLMVAALVGYAVVLAIGRQRDDAIHWRPALMLSAGALVLIALAALPELLADLRLSSNTLTVVLGSFIAMAVVVVVGILLFVVFPYASGESLAAELNLPVSDGVQELTRGRGSVPELAMGAAAGTALGLLIAGFEGIVGFAWTRAFDAHLNVELPKVLGYSIPLPEILGNLGISIVVAVGIMFVQVLLWRWKRSTTLVLLMPGILFTLMLAGVDDLTAPARFVGFVTTVLVSLAIWRYGLLAGIVAQFIAEIAWPVLAVGMSSPASTATLVAIAAVAAPVALAALGYRRFARS